MDDIDDNELTDMVLNMLADLKAEADEIEEKRKKQLWKYVELPCSLYDALMRLTKAELDGIRKEYNFKNISNLNKANLAFELVRGIPMRFKYALDMLDQLSYSFIKEIVENSGVVADPGLAVPQLDVILKFSLVFPGIYYGQKILFMPEEIIEAFKKADDQKLKKIVQRNSQWVKLTDGMLYYYGVMNEFTIMEKLEKLIGQKINYYEFAHVIRFASDFYSRNQHNRNGFYVSGIIDVNEILMEQESRDNIDYHPFTKDQFLEASNLNYYERTPEIKDFINFLLNNYEIVRDEIDEIIVDIIFMINSLMPIEDILEYLGNRLEFPTFEFVQEMTARIIAVHNSTRQWVLKGYSPNGLSQKGQEPPFFVKKTLEAKPDEEDVTNIIDFKTRAKIGRNDPCPCGSGKKFKRCCSR